MSQGKALMGHHEPWLHLLCHSGHMGSNSYGMMAMWLKPSIYTGYLARSASCWPASLWTCLKRATMGGGGLAYRGSGEVHPINRDSWPREERLIVFLLCSEGRLGGGENLNRHFALLPKLLMPFLGSFLVFWGLWILSKLKWTDPLLSTLKGRKVDGKWIWSTSIHLWTLKGTFKCEM